MTTECGLEEIASRPPNIYIIGAQSTGKTTLVSALSEHFSQQGTYSDKPVSQPKIITEVARGVLRLQHFTAADIANSKPRALQLQRLILQAQSEIERASLPDWYISDRSGLDPLAYAHRYVGDEDARQLRQGEAWKDVEKRLRAGLIIICGTGGDWLIDDGIRLMPESRDDWTAFESVFCSLLDEFGMQYTILPSSIRDLGSRVDFVIEKWKHR